MAFGYRRLRRSEYWRWESPTGKQVLAQQEKLVLGMTFMKSRHACMAIKTMSIGLLRA